MTMFLTFFRAAKGAFFRSARSGFPRGSPYHRAYVVGPIGVIITRYRWCANARRIRISWAG